MLPGQVIKRIPGTPAVNPRERQGYIEDLGAMGRSALKDILDRQDRLLASRSFISKLPDSGKKIREFRSRIEQLLAQQDEMEAACSLLSGLKLDEIEWTRGVGTQQAEGTVGGEDSDEDDSDPLRILASRGGVGTYRRQNRVIKEATLTTTEDMEDIKSLTHIPHASYTKEPHGGLTIPATATYVKGLCERVEKEREKKREPFRPYRTTVSGVHSSGRKPRPKGPHWEVTAATPPDDVHGQAKVISLGESMSLQKEQAIRLKEIQARQASEKLASQLDNKMGADLPDMSSRMSYRPLTHRCDSSSSSEEDESDTEEYEEPDKDEAIIYTITE